MGHGHRTSRQGAIAILPVLVATAAMALLLGTLPPAVAGVVILRMLIG